MIHKTTTLSLPFIGKEKNHLKNSYWLVPDVGNYNSGEQKGRSIAHQYLQQLKKPGYQPPCLALIAADICAVQPMSDARRGQLVGFFSAVENQLK